MKRYFFFVLLVSSLYSATYAQLPNVSAPTTNSVASIGQLASQLIGSLKPSSFTNAWSSEKANWLQKAQSMATDAQGLASSISSLAGFIKPDLFKKGFSAAGIADLAKNVTSLSGAAGLLKSFAGGLKPKAFNSDWKAQQKGWESALGMIQ